MKTRGSEKMGMTGKYPLFGISETDWIWNSPQTLLPPTASSGSSSVSQLPFFAFHPVLNGCAELLRLFKVVKIVGGNESMFIRVPDQVQFDTWLQKQVVGMVVSWSG